MISADPSSFRDPSAFIFHHDGVVYRHLQPAYQHEYEHLMASGLYHILTQEGLLITHEESTVPSPGAYKVIRPRQVKFINYPYEWGFEQLKAAALLTLRIQKTAMDHGMTLKDANAFNICFEGPRPVFIDSSSFALYDESLTWDAYHQFCQQFLCPLLLAHYRGSDSLNLIAQYPDGIPVALTAAWLPARSRFRLLPLLHIHLQKKMAASAAGGPSEKKFSKAKLLRILDHLESGIRSLHIGKEVSHWRKYYQETILSSEYLDEKLKAVDLLTRDLRFDTVLDLGANTGTFSKQMAERGKWVIAAEGDAVCVDSMQSLHERITPVRIDLMYPSPAIGWMNRERPSFLQRVKPDLVLSLALMHHLCITRNLSFDLLASGLQTMAPLLLIEFIPKSDPKVQTLLQHRADIFTDYHEEHFKKVFSEYFRLLDEFPLPGSHRKLFLFERK